MKIGEFAELNNVTTKMLRHYDEIGLLKPTTIDPETSYRSYTSEQSHLLNWIMILKNIDFSLSEIKELLSGPLESMIVIHQLTRKRIEITSALNEQIQKKIAIDRLITIIEEEGFEMKKKIDLQNIGIADVHEIKKNIPNMEMFLETAANIVALCSDDDGLSVFRFDISHFKQVNDDYGFEVGDKVIVACYKLIEANVNKYFSHATIGRAHGDEFIVFAKASKDVTKLTAQSIINDIRSFEFATIGCSKQMGCYIGGLASQIKNSTDIRKIIEASIEVIEHARRNGPNSFTIESYSV
ncbi:diguanylate cyclase domain-containing protein [Paenibacillus eucommiae]|uniref:Diguanylate cyclase (GGDEF)-like protein n=1 Tax=Paenibacillus eucommiae TaxID=1355755 RepID=A0ABS4J7B2_9BACL|nr:diguanylate cyclase [Paenibacillus eucommiae]MBP1994664.1 diguanylate cyclase (GGDEF)-like protein [Paenibacillus eucommiae]